MNRKNFHALVVVVGTAADNSQTLDSAIRHRAARRANVAAFFRVRENYANIFQIHFFTISIFRFLC